MNKLIAIRFITQITLVIIQLILFEIQRRKRDYRFSSIILALGIANILVSLLLSFVAYTVF